MLSLWVAAHRGDLRRLNAFLDLLENTTDTSSVVTVDNYLIPSGGEVLVGVVCSRDAAVICERNISSDTNLTATPAADRYPYDPSTIPPFEDGVVAGGGDAPEGRVCKGKVYPSPRLPGLYIPGREYGSRFVVRDILNLHSDTYGLAMDAVQNGADTLWHNPDITPPLSETSFYNYYYNVVDKLISDGVLDNNWEPVHAPEDSSPMD